MLQLTHYENIIFTPPSSPTNYDVNIIKIPPLVRQQAITTYNDSDISTYLKHILNHFFEDENDSENEYNTIEDEDENMIYLN